MAEVARAAVLKQNDQQMCNHESRTRQEDEESVAVLINGKQDGYKVLETPTFIPRDISKAMAKRTSRGVRCIPSPNGSAITLPLLGIVRHYGGLPTTRRHGRCKS